MHAKYACKRLDFKSTFYMQLRGMGENIYFVHMYFVAFCSLVLYKESGAINLDGGR